MSHHQPIQVQQRQGRVQPVELAALLLLTFSLFAYVAASAHPEMFPAVQTMLALLSFALLAVNRFDRRCFGQLTIVGLTIAIHFLPQDKLSQVYMCMPLLHVIDCPGIRAKLTTILHVTTQTLWMLTGLAACSYMFGGAAGWVYTQTDRFKEERMASLMFLKLATLDDIGKISRENMQERGFFVAIGTALVVLFVAHGLFNINTAFVLAYISDEHRSHKELLDVNRDLTDQDIPLQQRVLRVANIVCSVWVLFNPYDDESSVLYLAAAVVSTCLVHASEQLQDEGRWYRTLINFGTSLLVALSFLFGLHSFLYMGVVSRIFLIPQVKDSFKKVYKSMFQASSFLLFALAVFLIYSFLMQAINQNRTIYDEAIQAMQLACLDEHGTFLRQVDWYVGLIMIAYMIFFNHLIMNIVIGQLFNAIEQADIKRRLLECRVHSRPLSEVEDAMEAVHEQHQAELDDLERETHHSPGTHSDARQFVRVIKQLGYRPRHAAPAAE